VKTQEIVAIAVAVAGAAVMIAVWQKQVIG